MTRAVRFLSALLACFYLTLVVSVIARPPVPRPGSPATVFDVIAGAGLWAGILLMLALCLVVSAVLTSWLFGLIPTHYALAVYVGCYGLSNLLVSLQNATGWQVASLCGALMTLHIIVAILSERSFPRPATTGSP